MTRTTLLKRRNQMQRKPLPNCHKGEGALDWIDVLGGDDTQGRRLRFMHDNILAPGVSIGVHAHEREEEYYYIVSGQGTMTLDGERFAVGPGDITAVYPGGSHGLENTSDEEMRILVICAA